MNCVSLSDCLAQLQGQQLKILDFVTCVQRLQTSEVQIASELTAAFDARDWRVLQALVLVCAKQPSASYAHILCRILDEASEQMTNEDVVDVLDQIREPSTVSALWRAASYDLSIDEFHNLNKKCVYALGHISTSEAEAALSEIAKRNSFAEVRRAASQVLQRRQTGASPS
jgi:hypothetical protein